jgi:hypothetical protein
MSNNKYLTIQEFSNPSLVLQRAEDLFGPEVFLKVSTRKNKKYMIYLNERWVHFGEMGYEDYTKHLDEDRRELFRNRNASWVNYGYDTPAFLSYVLLW